MHNQSSTSIATAQTLTAGSSLYHIDGHGKHEGFNVTSPHSEKSSKSSEGKSLLNRSNSFSRFLGRSDSKKSSRSGQDVPPMPPSPKTIQKVGACFINQGRKKKGDSTSKERFWYDCYSASHWRKESCQWKRSSRYGFGRGWKDCIVQSELIWQLA